MKNNGIELSDIIRDYGKEYRQAYKTSSRDISIMNLIERCRSQRLGCHIEQCEECGTKRIAYNSCRNRHCPKCQNSSRERWVENRKEELLPIPYYHVVFTMPYELNKVALYNKRTIYGLLFKSSSETLLALGKDPKRIGAELGIISVLHTWGQALTEHPHIHCIVTGGGITPDGKKWKYPKKARWKKFFIHINVISDLYKKKFLYYLKKAYRQDEIKTNLAKKDFNKMIDTLYEKKWITYCKRPFGGAEQVIEYLGRYTHRVAITNSRIKAVKEGRVTFTYKDYRDDQNKEMEITAIEFIRRFMLHVLPEGFFKIRYYGILSSREKKTSLEKCLKIFKKKKNKEIKFIRIKICPSCREKLKLEKLRIASG